MKYVTECCGADTKILIIPDPERKVREVWKVVCAKCERVSDMRYEDADPESKEDVKE